MIIITGGAGFIGSNLALALNNRGIEDILIVDDLTDGTKFRNLADTKITDYMDLSVFRERFNANTFNRIEAVFHLGACSDTTLWDGKYMMDNNYEYSKELALWCHKNLIPFIYASSASVYGDGSKGFSESIECEKPLNVYAYSKWLFDQWIRKQSFSNQVVGLRYFNVYGKNEAHKNHMASVAYHLLQQYQRGETLKLFGEYDGYQAGEQQRDFIYVDDAVNVNLWFWDNPQTSGIFNCGTGEAQTFNDIAYAIQAIHKEVDLEYIPFPEKLKNAYQSYTQADISKLREAGYSTAFKNLSQGVKNYIAKQ
jgi:ADP-L-glycero-D-manno-heptose 6-epimerase